VTVLPLVAWLLAFGSIAVVVVALAVLRSRRNLRRRTAAQRVPQAVALAGRRYHVARAWPLALAACGCAATAWIYITWTEVMVVRDRDGEVEVKRAVHVGSYEPFGATPFAHSIWIENDSSRLIHVEIAQYGGGTPSAVDPTDLAPGERRVEPRIDFVGPDDAPPGSIPASGQTVAYRLWLTWDRLQP
jgi:hypothetical protein